MREQPEDKGEATEQAKEHSTEQAKEAGEGRIPLRDQWDKLKEKLTAEDPGFSKAAQVRTAIGIIALVGMLLPWLKLDGYNEAMSAAELAAYSFTSPDRGAMFGISIIGAIAVLFTPHIAVAVGFYGFIRLVQGGHSLSSHFTGAVLPLVMVLIARPMISSDGPELMGVPIPGIGLIITVLAQGALFTDGITQRRN